MKIRMAKHYDWLLERCGGPMTPNFAALEILDRQGRIVGMIGFDNWTPTSAQIFVALDTPLAARFAKPVFMFPFGFMKVKTLWGHIGSKNERSLRFAKKIGFREVYRMPGAWREGEDMVIVEMNKDECRFIEKEAA